MSKVAYYAFYGSLRKGMYNYELFKSHLEYQFTERLPGFRLHALSHYPIAVKSDSTDDLITVEIFALTDLETRNKIHQIEMDAGYYFEEIIVRGISAMIYLFENSSGYPLVPDGDWVRHFESMK
jgi:gamma-glutamylcyclotransferase (GGCT)/AIG2-like uncharacterized protein YtfP